MLLVEKKPAKASKIHPLGTMNVQNVVAIHLVFRGESNDKQTKITIH